MAQAAREAGIPRTTFRDRVAAYQRDQKTVFVRDQLQADARPNEIVAVDIDHRHEDRLYLYALGDVHKGAAQHLDEAWAEWRAYIAAADHVAALFTGDGLNAAIPGSKSDPFEERQFVGPAMQTLEEELEEIQDKLDAIIAGNHDLRIYKLTGLDPMQVIARNLGVPYDQTSLLLRYWVGDNEEPYRVYLRHGTGSPASPGPQANQMMKSRDTIDADIYITGHTHKQMAFPLDKFRDGPNGITRHKQLFVSSGSFVGYERYAQERGWSPTHPGAPRIFLDGKRRDFHVSI